MMDLIETTPKMDLAIQDIAHLVEELRASHAIDSPLFQRREQREAAHADLQGLRATLPRKSLEPMVLAVAGVLPAEAWTRQTITEGSQGPMVADCAAIWVSAVRDTLPGPAGWVVRRRHLETGELTTSLCHAPVDTALATPVPMSGRRWPIATCFEDSKQRLGMGDDTVRSWTR